MFTTGQWTFAALFLVVFIVVIAFSYRKDIATHRQFYKGNYKVLIGFLLFVAILFVIKKFLKR